MQGNELCRDSFVTGIEFLWVRCAFNTLLKTEHFRCHSFCQWNLPGRLWCYDVDPIHDVAFCKTRLANSALQKNISALNWPDPSVFLLLVFALGGLAVVHRRWS